MEGSGKGKLSIMSKELTRTIAQMCYIILTKINFSQQRPCHSTEQDP